MKLELNVALFLSKFILVVALGVSAGILFTQSDIEDDKKGKELTLEKYTAGYEEYKQSLIEKDEPSYGVGIVVFLLMFGAVIIFYEIAALLISLVIKLLLKSAAVDNKLEI